MGKILLQQGDICKAKVGAIVNAANDDLMHGGGVAAAIVKAGGEIIQKQSNRVGPISLGEAAVTSGGKLEAKYVIHAASMRLGELASEENVKKAIINSFKRAEELGLKTIAFPAIGAGIAQFPIEKCAEVSLSIAKQHAEKFDNIFFILYNDQAFKAFNRVYQEIFNN